MLAYRLISNGSPTQKDSHGHVISSLAFIQIDSKEDIKAIRRNEEYAQFAATRPSIILSYQNTPTKMWYILPDNSEHEIIW